MIEHLCLFKCKATLGEQEYEGIRKRFENLKGIIPGLLEVSIGRNVTEEIAYANGYQLGMRMLFASQANLSEYLIHPAHQNVSEYVFTCIESVTVCDFLV